MIINHQLPAIAKDIRKKIVTMHQIGPNVGSAMSIADIIAVLFFQTMRFDDPGDPLRDRFILSKGHAVSAVYAAFSIKGFIPERDLVQYLRDGSPLTGHPIRGSIPGIDVSSGSLGHGLAIGAGLAWAAKNDNLPWRCFVLMGDGECQEGSVWEAAAISARLNLDNLIAIVDMNKLQGYERTVNILPGSNVMDIWRAYGWEVVTVDGHDHAALTEAFAGIPLGKHKPTAVIVDTIKGKGVREMENCLGWHYYSVPSEKLSAFLAEIEEDK